MHKDFLKAAQEVLRTRSNVTFLVVGDDGLLLSLKEIAQRLEIEEHVKFLGHRAGVSFLLQQTDIKVIASLSEGVPLTAFEATAAGCVIVATEVGRLSEVLTDNETACLVPSKNSKAIAEKLQWLLDNEPQAKEMGKKAREAAHGYDIRKTFGKIEACYRQVLGAA